MNAVSDILHDDRIDQIRAEAKRVTADAYPSQAAAARDSGVAESTFAAFLAGTYAGDNTRVAAKVQVWLQARAERAKTASIIPTAPAFQPLPTAARIIPVLQWAQMAPDFCPIIGAPGIGKTTALEHYRDTNPNVWLVTMEPCWSSANAMLAAICAAMEIDERSAMRLSNAIRSRLKGLKALIIIDEAQHLSTSALDQLRTIHDKARVGIAVCGNRQIHARLVGKGDESTAQLFSRAGMKFKSYQPIAGDLCQLIAAWGVSDPREVDFLKQIGRKPGALRNIDKVMKLASMLAAGAGEERALPHLRGAWEQFAVDLAAGS